MCRQLLSAVKKDFISLVFWHWNCFDLAQQCTALFYKLNVRPEGFQALMLKLQPTHTP